jgi:hypothetical protein
MSCDYYIQTELIIEYLDKMGRTSFIYTNRNITKGYIYSHPHDSRVKSESLDLPYESEIRKRIRENTYKKVIFDNNNWTEELYKQKYEALISNEFNKIDNIIKIYEKLCAWERN